LQLAQKEARKPETPFMGFNIMEFQVNYDACHDKDEEWETDIGTECAERKFGIFGLGDLEMGESAQVPVLRHSERTREVPINCLFPESKPKLQAIASVLGGTVPDTKVCEAGKSQDPPLHCVADRSANLSFVRRQARFACERLRGMYDCDETPAQCTTGYVQADWLFSIAFAHYQDEHPRYAKSMCHFSGAGLLTPIPPRPDCTADVATVGASLNHAPTPADRAAEAQEAGGSIAVLMGCLLSLVCTLAGCWHYLKRGPGARNWRGGGMLNTEAGLALDSALDNASRGTLELADWHESLPSGGQPDGESW